MEPEESKKEISPVLTSNHSKEKILDCSEENDGNVSGEDAQNMVSKADFFEFAEPKSKPEEPEEEDEE